MIPGMPRVRDYPGTIQITKLDTDGVPAGDPVTVPGHVMSIREEIRPTGRVPHPRYRDLFKDEEVIMYDPTTRRTTRIDTGNPVRLTPEQESARKEMLSRLHSGLDLPPFLLEEKQREEDHALQVRRDKKRRKLGEMYPAAPGKWLDDAVDQAIPRTVPVTSSGVASVWVAPPSSSSFWEYEAPGLPTVNHPCKLLYSEAQFPDWIHDIACLGKKPPQQEEGPHSMYTSGAIEQAERILEQEREAREAAEIIDRIKAFGEDVYADDTVLRVTRRFYKNAAKTQLHDPAVFAIIRYTDDSGNTRWSDDTGTKRTWDALVAWFVTYGKPVTLADVEIFPPAKFPAESGTVVSTTITGTVQ